MTTAIIPGNSKKGEFAMANPKERNYKDICGCCNNIYIAGIWREPAEVDLEFMSLELKKTICPDCTFERYPKFYMSSSSSKDRATKKLALKIGSLLKRPVYKI